MENGEKVIKHLEMIQAIIERMARNSFMLKGWSVTLVTVLLWLFARFFGEMKAGETIIIGVIIVAIVFIFWRLDGYFLRQERLFRNLYDHIRVQERTDFTMDVSLPTDNVDNIWDTCFCGGLHNTLLIFYLPLLLVEVVIGLGFFIIYNT